MMERRWVVILYYVVTFILGFNIVAPIFDNRFRLVEIISAPDPDPDPPAYVFQEASVYGGMNHWLPNWSYVKTFLRDNMWWRLQASPNNSTWYDADDALTVELEWTGDAYKVSLVLNTSVAPRDLYYRFDLACNKSLKGYAEVNGWEWRLTVPANLTEDYTLFFNWSDIRGLVDSGKVWFDRGVKDNFFWFRVQTVNRISPGLVFVVDPVYGVITDAVVDSWEWDAGTVYLSNSKALCRLGESEYYVVGASNIINVMKVWDSNGTFVETLVDTWSLTTGSGVGVVHISGDVYAIYYRNATSPYPGDIFTTTIWETNGTLKKDIIDIQKTENSFSYYSPCLLNVVDDIYALIYADTLSGDYDHHLETFSILGNGSITFKDSWEFDTTSSAVTYDSGYGVMIDSDTLAIVWGENAGDDGWLGTVNISSAGVITKSWASSWEWDDSIMSTNYYSVYIHHIAGNVFGVIFSESDYDGWCFTVTIADNGAITKSYIDSLEFDTADYRYGMMFTVNDASDFDPGVYGVTYQGPSSDGFVCTFNISSDGTIGDSIIDVLEFDAADNMRYAPCVHIADDYYLIVYTSTGADGWAITVEILTAEGGEPEPTPGWKPLSGGPGFWNISFLNQTYFKEQLVWNISFFHTQVWESQVFLNISFGHTQQWEDQGYWNTSFLNDASQRDLGFWNTSFLSPSSYCDLGFWNLSFENTLSFRDFSFWNISFVNSSVEEWVNQGYWNLSFSNHTTTRELGFWNTSFSNDAFVRDFGYWNVSFQNTQSTKELGYWNISFKNRTAPRDIGFWNVSFRNVQTWNNQGFWNTSFSNTQSWKQQGFWNISFKNTSIDVWKIQGYWNISFKNGTYDIVYVDDDAPAGWYNETHLHDIQEGVDVVNRTGRVRIYDGVYTNHVMINKTVTLLGNGSTTVLEHSQNIDRGIYIDASDSVNIWSLNISGSNDTIYVHDSHNMTLNDSIIFANEDCIQAVDSRYCIVTNNTLRSNYTGVEFSGTSTYGHIKNNTIHDCLWSSVYVTGSSEHTHVLNNTILDCDYTTISCNNNTVRYNNISDGAISISMLSANYNEISNNTLTNPSSMCIYFSGCSNNTISNNTLDAGTSTGIFLNAGSENNTIYNNYISTVTPNKPVRDDCNNNKFNISQTLGTNIIGGPYFGGNYYSNNTNQHVGDGFSVPYHVRDGVVIDYLPLIYPIWNLTGGFWNISFSNGVFWKDFSYWNLSFSNHTAPREFGFWNISFSNRTGTREFGFWNLSFSNNAYQKDFGYWNISFLNHTAQREFGYWNTSFRNTQVWKDQSFWNTSFGSGMTFRDFTLWNLSFRNSSTSVWVRQGYWNLSFSHTQVYENLGFWNISFLNTTAGIEITDHFPANGSGGIASHSALYITINSSRGYKLNITWFGSTDNGSSWFYLGHHFNITNGTYNTGFFNATVAYHRYDWRVWTNDGHENYNNDTLYYTVGVGGGSNMMYEDGMYLIAVGLLLGFVLGPDIFEGVKKRRKRR